MNAPNDRPPLPQALVAALSASFGTRFSLSEAVRLHHGKDESSHPPQPPDAVVFAETTEEVAAVVRLCHQYKTPVIAYGTGTSLEGHLLAVRGGVCIDLSAMNRILAIRADDLDATVQCCVTRKALNAGLHGSGLFFPIDPGADASLGGDGRHPRIGYQRGALRHHARKCSRHDGGTRRRQRGKDRRPCA